MKTEDRERIEKELYKAIDDFTGNRETHAPTLVNDIMKIIIHEREKAIDRCWSSVKNQTSDCSRVITVNDILSELESIKLK